MNKLFGILKRIITRFRKQPVKDTAPVDKDAMYLIVLCRDFASCPTLAHSPALLVPGSELIANNNSNSWTGPGASNTLPWIILNYLSTCGSYETDESYGFSFTVVVYKLPEMSLLSMPFTPK